MNFLKTKLLIFISIVLLYSTALSIPDASAQDPLWTDEFTSYHSRWEWSYNAGTGYQQLTTTDGVSAVELGVTSGSSSSSYSDCSLHEKRDYYLYTGVFEARLRYDGNYGNDQFGTMGWGVWNYEDTANADAIWFWDASEGDYVGLQAMVAIQPA